MKIFALAILTTVFTAVPAFSSEVHPQPPDKETFNIVCSSSGGYTECETGVTVAEVKLVKQFSQAACTFGGTWGYHDTRVWVNHGCKAKFSYEDANAPVPTPTPEPTPVPTPQPRPPKLSVDCRWNNSNWQPYYRITGMFIGRWGHGFQDPNVCSYSVRLSREDAICNWNGVGFTSYDITSNAEVVPYSFATIEGCYDAIPQRH